MEILVDGNRSTSENWQAAQLISSQALPPITAEEEQVAKKLAISPEGYQRSKYAVSVTRQQLEARARQVGKLVEDWLATRDISAHVQGVWLKTFDGKFRLELLVDGTTEWIFISEDLMNDLLDAGSAEAATEFDRLLAVNLSSYATAKAS